MQRYTSLALVFFGFAVLLTSTGCPNSAPAPKPGANGGGGAEAGHSHDVAGPHMGQVLGLGDEEYHAELVWDDDSGKVTVYLLDKDMKVNTAAASAQETITIEAPSGAETKKYELAAVDRTTGDKPMASQYELIDKELVGAIETNNATLHVTIGGKPYTQKINFDDHTHAHSHK